jgi:spectinomycin phosphotransferase
MRDEPENLPRAFLTEELGAHWGIEVWNIEYAPVGAGSYHWVAEDAGGGRWFVTADNLWSLGTQEGDPDAAFAGLAAAYQTAAALRDAGLSHVVAPSATKAGRVVVRILPDWAVAAFPFIEGQSSKWGDWADASQRMVAARLIGQLHNARPPSMIGRWDFAIPHRGALDEALQDLTRPWATGPYAERTRTLLAASRAGLEALSRHYDRLAETVASFPDPWVVTHGEPHSANFITAHDGGMYLIDWDTVRLGPRERDLEIVVGDWLPTRLSPVHTRHARRRWSCSGRAGRSPISVSTSAGSAGLTATPRTTRRTGSN